MSKNILVKEGIIITMDDNRRVLKNGSVLIQDDKILKVDKTESITKKYRVDQVIEAKNKIVLPGLINTHHHPGLISSRNLGIEKFKLDHFLNNFFYPILEALTSDHVYWASMLAYAQAIKGGVTCVNDMFCKIVERADAAEEIGIRALLSGEAADMVNGQETIKDNEEAFIKKNGVADGRIKVWFGVEWIPVCSPEFIMKTRELADKYETGIHIHLNESIGEVEICKERYGKRPTEHAYNLGLLGTDVVAAHSVWLSDKEIQIMKDTKTNIAHCPAQNMATGVGIARIPELISAGINVGLGTDAYPDMLETLRCAKMMQHIAKLDATIMPPSEIFEMATLKGAKALNQIEKIGSLQSGKKADIIILNVNKLRWTPKPIIIRGVFNPFPQLLWVSNNSDIETVIIDGKIIVNNGILQTVDEKKVMGNAIEAFEDLISVLD